MLCDKLCALLIQALPLFMKNVIPTTICIVGHHLLPICYVKLIALKKKKTQMDEIFKFLPHSVIYRGQLL